MNKDCKKNCKLGENYCNCPYSIEPINKGRAKWICPICGRDVSIEYVLLKDLENN